MGRIQLLHVTIKIIGKKKDKRDVLLQCMLSSAFVVYTYIHIIQLREKM